MLFGIHFIVHVDERDSKITSAEVHNACLLSCLIMFEINANVV